MKAYVKPELFYERYELSQYIASCAARWWFVKGAYECNLSVSGSDTYFSGDTGNCDIPVLEDKFEVYCYTNDTADGLPLFAS